MSRRKIAPLPRNLLLRRTVSHLLLAAPVLPLVGCTDTGCQAYRPATRRLTYENVTLADGSLPTSEQCMELCVERKHTNTTGCRVYSPTVDGGSADAGSTGVRLECTIATMECADGRRPEGLRESWAEADCPLGAQYARMAWLEAASVPAFLRLAEELAAHGAPEVLVQAARRSAREEVRHARAMEALARHHGASVPEVEIAPFHPRSLEAMLWENAREGCVRETYGAVVAGWQARAAAHEQVRRVLGRIAADELRHAELAWAVEAWADTLLSAQERQRLREVRLQALHELESQVAAEQPSELLIREAGLPSREAALQLLQGLDVLVA